MPSELLCRTTPYNKSTLQAYGFDPDDVTCVELGGGELYELVAAHVASHAERGARHDGTFTLQISRSKAESADEEDEGHRVAVPSLGLGLFRFAHTEPARAECASDASNASTDSMVEVAADEARPTAPTALFALHQTLGEVVGTDCGARLYKSLLLIAPGRARMHLIQSFVDALLARADATEAHRFTCYRWHVQHQYWRSEETALARPIESVVLPDATKAKVLADLDDFVARGTARWYREHGIPYKRAYLLHGVPGAGKTSLIQALAGRYKRNLAILQPSHPDMTDDALKAAVQRVPHRSIIVLEDVDALFGTGRRKAEGDKSSLTFSGVLNALDGVGGCAGQIFILTTNHRERLDPALIRNGRVDLHVEFTYAGREQMRGLFLSFYRDAPSSLADAFASGLAELLGERQVTAAQLQHYFISMRKASAEAASVGFAKVLEEAEAHGQMETEQEKEGKEEKDKEEQEKKQKKAKAKKDETDEEDEMDQDQHQEKPRGGGAKAKQVHVHIH